MHEFPSRHIWMCKTRQVSIFKHGLFKNPVTIYGTFIAVTVALIIIYGRWIHACMYGVMEGEAEGAL